MRRVNILGVEIDNLNLGEVVEVIDNMVQRDETGLIVTANPEIVMLAKRDRGFMECLEGAKIVTADGIGIVIAARVLGSPLKQRVTGIDLVTSLFERAKKDKYRFYLVGAKPGVAEKAAANIKQRFPWVEIVGIHHGYFQDDSQIIEDIKGKKPHILLAALGMGRQERWIREKIQSIGVPVSIGVGGSFDVFAGEAKRAPIWMQRAGLEWLYRLILQPSRIGRMLQLPKFLAEVIVSRFKD